MKGASVTMSEITPEPSEPIEVYIMMKGTMNALSTYTSIEGIMDPIKTLIDSGSSLNFLDIGFARRHSIPLIELPHPKIVIGIDGKEVKERIRHKVRLNLEIEDKKFSLIFHVMSLGDTPMILGLPWLQEANPIICWKDFSLTFHEEEKALGKKGNISELPEELRGFEEVFSEELFKQLPEHRPYDCAINFKEGATIPKPGKVYPMSPAESRAMKEYLDKELDDGKIVKSESEYASPCFFVNKTDGGLRLVVDYWEINKITVNDQFPMPIQADLLEKIKDAKIFSKLDLRQGYNNIRIKEGDEKKTAFRTKSGLYEYTVMPFGLKNAPAVFQQFMNDIFSDLIDVTVIVYLDDILIYSNNREDHIRDVREVLRRIRDNNLFLKLSKC